ncbi:MAG TPA: small ribosomal subunit Rsm22 family protein [Myxococcaceae bacterium]|nr:small ribosomal subunit Rsm22 family protein [Myxococcaceae bacterium]
MSSLDPNRALARWMPRLVAVWRRHRRLPVGPPTLVGRELKEVAQGIRTLSVGLTRDRALVGARYLDDPRLLGAYLLFYWPVSYAQARSVLGELGRRPRSVLDLGSGPGPIAFAALDAGASEVTAADRSTPALALARALAAEAEEPLASRAWSGGAALPEGAFDVITLGHVLNELGRGAGALAERAALLERAAERLRPGGSVVVLEPALRDTSRELLQVRDLLVGRGYAVRAPCLWRGPCPALVKPSDWCHAERSWSPPPLLDALAREAGLHKEALKMSYLVLAPRGEAWAEPPPGRPFRIVSEPLEGKGRQRFMGCGPEGRVGLALQEKHRTPANEAFFSLRRGDVIAVEGTEPRGDGLALVEGSLVRKVAAAGQPLAASSEGV